MIRLIPLRLSGPFRPLHDGGWSCAVVICARLSARSTRISILRCNGKALTACEAMRARMARSRPAHCSHTVGRRDCTALIMTIILTLPWWEATQLAGLVGGSFPPWVTKLFGVFDGFNRCAAGFEPSNPVSLPRACPCSARACLDPLTP